MFSVTVIFLFYINFKKSRKLRMNEETRHHSDTHNFEVTSRFLENYSNPVTWCPSQTKIVFSGEESDSTDRFGTV